MNTAYDYFRQACRLEEPDRVPVALLATSSFVPGFSGINHLDYYGIPDKWLEAQLALLRRFPDVVWVPGPCVDYSMASVAAAYGARLYFYPNRPPAWAPLIKDLSYWADVEPVNPKEHGLMPLILRQEAHVEARLQSEGFGMQFAFSWGPMSIAATIMGIPALLTSVMDEPGMVARLLETMTTSSIRWLHAQLDLMREPMGLLIGDDVTGMVSRKHFEALIFPCLERMAKEFDGLIRIYHNDTPCQHLFRGLAQTGFDVFNFSHEHDIGEVKASVGHRMALMGNISPLEVGLRGTPQDVRRAAQACLDKGAPGGGMILSFGGGTDAGTSAENLDAMIATAREWRYPRQKAGSDKPKETR